MTRRVAFFIPFLQVGGAQRITVTLANGLSAHGHDVDLVLSYREGDLLGEVDESVRIIDLDAPRVPGLGILSSVPGLRRYYRRVAPDVLISELTDANVAALLAKSTVSTPTRVVPTEHRPLGLDPSTKGFILQQMAKVLYRNADHAIGVSTGVAESIADYTLISADNIRVQYNPVPIDHIRVQANSSVDEPWFDDPALETIVSVGRLAPQKDFRTLLHAFAALIEERPQTRLIIVGDGPERDELITLSESLGIERYVTFPGYVPNAYAYMGHGSVFVLSSHYEGLPTVLIEALACGCPIVATDCPSGPREVLADGEYGRLVPPETPTAMQKAIRETLTHPTVPESQRSRAADFSEETIIGEYVELLDQISSQS